MDFLTLLVLILATWRISSLLVSEDGPFKIFARFRILIIRFTEVFSCLWCASIWIGLGFTILYTRAPEVAFWIALPFALSAGAILWDKHNG